MPIHTLYTHLVIWSQLLHDPSVPGHPVPLIVHHRGDQTGCEEDAVTGLRRGGEKGGRVG